MAPRLNFKQNPSPPVIIQYDTKSESSRLQGFSFEIEMSEAKNIAFLEDFQTELFSLKICFVY